MADDAAGTNAQIGPYVKALEAIIYDYLMEQTKTGPCLDKYEDVQDADMAAEMRTLVEARDCVHKVVEGTQRSFLSKHAEFVKKSRKTLRAMTTAQEVTNEGTLMIDGVPYGPDNADIYQAWWYVRRAPDILLRAATSDNIDEMPIEDVAEKWFAAIKTIHNCHPVAP